MCLFYFRKVYCVCNFSGNVVVQAKKSRGRGQLFVEVLPPGKSGIADGNDAQLAFVESFYLVPPGLGLVCLRVEGGQCICVERMR